jgi:hypothetical protein
MEGISRILIAIVVSFTWVLVSAAYVARSDSTGTSVPIEEQSENAVLEREFKIKYSQELTVKGQGLKVKFDSLLEDSRCPTDVKCVWEGDAKILISVRRASAKESKMELHTNGRFSQAGKYRQYVIKLVTLSPYPRTSVKTKQSDYVATLLIKKE